MSTNNYYPRLYKITRSPNGYGFHLHGEKGKFGQIIRKIEPDSPAASCGLRLGDRVVAVNGKNVENCTHQQVVAKIKEKTNETILLVVDKSSDEYFQKNNILITEKLAKDDIIKSKIIKEPAEENNQIEEPAKGSASAKESAADDPRRPRLCHLIRDSDGFKFNLHSDKSRKGRYIRTVDEDGPAMKAGLLAGDRLIEVNGKNMEFDRHQDVVQTIKNSGEKVDLLVVSEESDRFFKSCGVTPTAAHCTSSLPTPLENPPAEANVTASKPSAATTNDVNLLKMDLTTLKQMSRPNRKKAPTSDWNNRQAIFNNL